MRNILLILLMCFSLTSFSQPLVGIIASSQNNVAVTPPNWNIFSEGFEGTGYQNSWTESLGANAGNIANEDATDVTPVGGSQSLHIVRVITPTATAAAAKVQIYTANFASVVPIAYMDFYAQIHSYSLPANNNMTYLMDFRDGSNNPVFTLAIRNVSGEYKLSSLIYNNGSTQYSYFPISGNLSLDVWYHVQMKYDVTNMRYSLTINNVAVIADSALTGTVKTGVQRLFMGDGNNAFPSDFYLDNLNISSTNF